MIIPRLSVNVDHVATLREARKTTEPSPIYAAFVVKTAGADGVTVHLRQDRRHINEEDVKLIRQSVDLPLTVEMGLFDDILEFVIQVKPFKVTLVPEREGEVTTEGGMNLADEKNFERVKEFSAKLKNAGIRVGVFIDPLTEMIDFASDLSLDFVEINTTEYSKRPWDEKILKDIRTVADYGHRKGLEIMAGHALNIWNVQRIAAIPEIEEFSIGHSIISRAIFVGLERAVREMKETIVKSRMMCAVYPQKK